MSFLPEDLPPGEEEDPEEEEEEEISIQPRVLLSRRVRSRSSSISPPPELERGDRRERPIALGDRKEEPPPPSPSHPLRPHPSWVARRIRPQAPESLSLGGDWWSLVRFVREVEAACTMPSQFDFDEYRIHMFFTHHPRPTTSDMPELRRFLEWFGQIGYYIVWCWQRINWEREQRHGMSSYSLWEIIDNRALLTNFVAMIQLHFTGSADDRGVKDPGRAGVRGREKQKQGVLNAFTCSWFTPTRDEQVIAQDATKSSTRHVGLAPRRTFTPLEERIAAKHLLLKWCAQASGVNTTTAPYRIPEERTDNEVQATKRVKQEMSDPNDEIGIPAPLLRNIIPRNSLVKAAAPGLLPVSQHVYPDIRAARVARDAARPPTAGLVEQSFAQMDVQVQQMYRQGIENLRSFSSSFSSEDVEIKLLTQSSIRDQVFFAEYCSILNAQYRVHTHRSRLSGVVRNRLSKDWTDLQVYFRRWAASSSYA